MGIEEGIINFGAWIERTRLSKEVTERVQEWIDATGSSEIIGKKGVSQGLFARWVTSQSGIVDQIGRGISESVIGRMEACNFKTEPPLMVIAALTAFDLLKIPTKFGMDPFTKEEKPIEWRYCRDTNEVIAVILGKLDPFTGKRIELDGKAKNGSAA